MHLTLGILRQSQTVFYALSFFWLDGFAVPTPAQVTQTVHPPCGRVNVTADRASACPPAGGRTSGWSRHSASSNKFSAAERCSSAATLGLSNAFLKKKINMSEDKIIISFGTTDLSGKGPGSYTGGVIKLWKDYSADVLSSARQFQTAAKVCLNDNKIEEGKSIQLVPGVVCAAFSCELALKWLIHRASGIEEKGHFLNKLYQKLGDADKAKIRNFTNDFDQFIDRNKNLFVDARYHHETSMFAFREQEILGFADYLMKYIDSINQE